MDQPADLHRLFPADLVERSLTASGSAHLALVRTGAAAERLAVLAPTGHPLLDGFDGERHDAGGGQRLLQAPCTPANARALRAALPNFQPRPLGLATSAGCGDRLGLATPGHVRAFEAVNAQAGARPVAAIFAQQSIREMARTTRTPAEVLADATWGAFEAGWRANVGADADHLKTTEDVDACAAEGFSFYTFDPGAHVDSAADADDPAAIERKVAALPWEALETTPADFRRRYAGRRVDVDARLGCVTAGHRAPPRLGAAPDLCRRAAVRRRYVPGHYERRTVPRR